LFVLLCFLCECVFWLWSVVIIVDVVFLYLFFRGKRRDVVGVCWCGGRLSAGNDGWFFSNRFCWLGCRYGVRSVVSIDVLSALYTSMFVEVRVIIILCMLIFIVLGYVQVIFSCCRFCILVFVGARLLFVLVVTVPVVSCAGVLILSPVPLSLF